MTIAELAQRLGVHQNTVRFHLDTLVANDQAERVEPARRSPGRPPQLFRVVPRMDPAGPRNYRMLAEALAEELASRPRPRERAVEAGRSWGRRAGDDAPRSPDQPVGSLVAMLDQLGFEPEQRTDSGGAAEAIGLRHCPFLELVDTRADVVCPLHLGLMNGALESWQAEVTVDRLVPFAEPDLCVAHLAAAGG
jgi:predicted ArsR family transcriptional regulator